MTDVSASDKRAPENPGLPQTRLRDPPLQKAPVIWKTFYEARAARRLLLQKRLAHMPQPCAGPGRSRTSAPHSAYAAPAVRP